MRFTIEFQADHLKRTLEAVRRAIATPQEMLGSIGEELLNANRDRHEKSLDPSGTPWKPLAASTLAAGKRKGGPLNKTGRMLQTLDYQVQGDTLRLGFDGGDGFKAKFHHFSQETPYVITPKKAKALKIGDRFYRRVNHPGLPKRELLGFPETDRRRVTEVLDDHLTRVINSVR